MCGRFVSLGARTRKWNIFLGLGFVGVGILDLVTRRWGVKGDTFAIVIGGFWVLLGVTGVLKKRSES